LDLLPLPTSFDFVHKEGFSKSKFIKEFHEKVKHQIQAHVEKIAHSKNKGKRVQSFNEGDLVWLHLRKERFPNIRKSKLSPRGDGPFQIIKKLKFMTPRQASKDQHRLKEKIEKERIEKEEI